MAPISIRVVFRALPILVFGLAGTLPGQTGSTAAAPRHAARVATAHAFMERVERELDELRVRASQARWVAANFINDDTEAISAEASKNLAIAVQRFAIEAKRFERLRLPAELRRKFTLLKLALSAPPPGNPAEAAELSRLSVAMVAEYGKGMYCRAAKTSAEVPNEQKKECLQINALSRILATSRDPDELLDVWQGWHRIGSPLRDEYQRFVELSNKGARQRGFADVGAMWRSNYDMPPDQFEKEVERLWNQVRPLYVSLHAFVRAKLGERYGAALVPANGMIPAHLLGNMWAQEWANIYPLVAPSEATGPGYDVTELLKQKGVDQIEMTRIAERFFTSLGLPALPATFWQRSLFVKPRDREVVCQGSAGVVTNKEDVRIKMCTEVTGDYLVRLHHELGHIYYFLAAKDQPFSFREGANDGFHEAVGDAIGLSITPEYLRTIGLLGQVPSAAADTMLLLREALDKIAFLPFGLLIDQWRWKVFSGEVTPASYNRAWWELRNKYQGVSAPLPRSETDFDPGAKFHVPANTPYTRYFLARVLQFQFYRALCREAGHTGPLHRCSFYGNRRAGEKLWAMLQLGASRPWPEALYALTGERQMDADAILDYFAPLKAWLDEQNRGRTLGWIATTTTLPRAP